MNPLINMPPVGNIKKTLKDFLVLGASIIAFWVFFLIFFFLVLQPISNQQQEISFFKILNFVCAFSALGFTVLFLLLFFKILKSISLMAGKSIFSKILSIGLLSLFYFKFINALVIVPINSWSHSIESIYIHSISDISSYISNKGQGYLETGQFARGGNYYSSKNSNSSWYSEGYSKGFNDGYEDGYLDGTKTVYGNQVKDSGEGFFSKTTNLLMSWNKVLFSNFRNFMNAFFNPENIRTILKGFFLLALTGFLADLYVPERNEKGLLKEWVQKEKLNLLFVAIFTLGTFLSISAVITIPILKQGDITEGIGNEDYQNNIEKIYQGSLIFDDSFKLNAEQDSFKEILQNARSIRAGSDTIRSQPKKDQIIKVTEEYIQKINDISFRYNVWKKGLENAKSSFKNDVQDKKNYFIGEYQNWAHFTAVGNERSTYFRSSLNSYRDYIDSYKKFINANLMNLNRAIAYNSNSLSLIKTNLDKLISQDDYDNVNFMDWYLQFDDPYPDWTFTYLGYIPSLHREDPQGIRILGQWLIDSRSSEMVLIVGMLGFGLLGAGVSSLIRNRDMESESKFKKSVGGILIGGTSASMIIFLGAKGGFAILSNQDVDLNPYALLFLCLLGSVYSELVWEKAYDYLDKRSEKHTNQAVLEDKTEEET